MVVNILSTVKRLRLRVYHRHRPISLDWYDQWPAITNAAVLSCPRNSTAHLPLRLPRYEFLLLQPLDEFADTRHYSHGAVRSLFFNA